MASAFNALLNNVRAQNRAMASIGQARAGITASGERLQIERAQRQIADKQLKEEIRRGKKERKAKTRGGIGGYIGGLLGPKAGMYLASLASASLGPLGMAAAAGLGAYGGAKLAAGGKNTGVQYKYKPINEADITNLSSGYFYKPQREEVEYDISRINTEGRSMEDIFKASKEGVAQQMALSAAKRTLGQEVYKMGKTGDFKDLFNFFEKTPSVTSETFVRPDIVGGGYEDWKSDAIQRYLDESPQSQYEDTLLSMGKDESIPGSFKVDDFLHPKNFIENYNNPLSSSEAIDYYGGGR
tara:strand:+ start:597 stop:1490 length:894 start_codon:yes stop_codon:yes gene_type:complete